MTAAARRCARCYANSQVILSSAAHNTRVYTVFCVCVCVCHSVEHNIRRVYYTYTTVLLYYYGRGKRSIVLVLSSFAAVINGRSAPM